MEVSAITKRLCILIALNLSVCGLESGIGTSQNAEWHSIASDHHLNRSGL